MLPQWVTWRLEEVKNNSGTRLAKIPYSVKTNGKASSTNPNHWATYEEVIKATSGGNVGFVFSPNDPTCGIDLDHCRDAATGKIEPWAFEIVQLFNSYTEISPSGTGLHIFIEGELSGVGNRKGQIEIYTQGRYFIVTGEHLPGTPWTVEPRQEELNKFHSEIFNDKPKIDIKPVSNFSDDELLRKAFNSKHGGEIQLLYSGNWQGAGYKSQSEADQALANHLSFWFGKDPAKVDFYFRQSGLFRPKWDEKYGNNTYGQLTINKAVSSNFSAYSPLKLVDRNFTNLETVEAEEEVLDAIPWPEPIGDEGFHGLAGKVVGAIMSYSEADPAAALINFLVGFGNLIGRTAYFMADREHYTNLFAMIVGDTSMGKKGQVGATLKRFLPQ